MPPSKPLDDTSKRFLLRRFEKYGMQFRYVVLQEQVPEWQPTADATEHGKVDWKFTGRTVLQHHVISAHVVEHGEPERAICLYSTPDGPILAVEETFGERIDDRVLRHPCIVHYQGAKIQFMPVFCAGRTLFLKGNAIRAVQTPSELLLAAYPGFIVQSQMCRFQVNPPHAIHEQEEDWKPPPTPQLHYESGIAYLTYRQR